MTLIARLTVVGKRSDATAANAERRAIPDINVSAARGARENEVSAANSQGHEELVIATVVVGDGDGDVKFTSLGGAAKEVEIAAVVLESVGKTVDVDDSVRVDTVVNLKNGNVRLSGLGITSKEGCGEGWAANIEGELSDG